MKTIRLNSFETNSSSMHSINLSNSKYFKPDMTGLKIIGNTAYISGETEFGWGEEEYTDLGSKIFYLLLDNWCSEQEMTKKLNKILGTEDVKYDNYRNGYIDHQSVGTSDIITDKDFQNFLFDSSSVLVIDNDNH